MRPAHVSLEASSVLGRLAVIALLALSLPALSEAQVAQPVDPVSGLAIPLLPGQFYTRMPSGCWMITDDPSANWANYYQFLGPCTFGVINGPGMVVDRETARVEDREPVVLAELGEMTPSLSGSSSLYAVRTSSHDLLETMALKRTIKPTSDLFQRRGSDGVEILVNYSAYEHGRQTAQDLNVHRAPCPVYPGLTKATLRENIASGRNLAGTALSAATDFCMGQVAKLRKAYGESVDNFRNVDFGFYYLVRLRTSVVRWEPDGHNSTSEGETYDVRLCPDLTSLTGCEAVWQQMLAPFIAKFDQLKPQEAALLAQHRAERRQRFAPLARAWRNRILAATGATPVRSD